MASLHRIKLGRPGDFADCPVIIDDDNDGDDELINIVTKTVAPLQLQSPPSPSPISPHSPFLSSLSSPPSSPLSSPPPSVSTPSRMLLRNVSVRSHTSGYAGMDRPNKRKCRCTLYGPCYEDARSRSPSITSVNKSRQPVKTIVQPSLPQSLQTTSEESVVPEGESSNTSLSGVADASEDTASTYQITQPLEGGISEILQFEDAVDIMTSVVVSAVKIRIQAGKFGFKQIHIGITTNITKIRKYTEQSLVELLFDVAIEKIAKTGAGCVGIGLQKVWEEAFYWDIIKRYAMTIDPMPTARGPRDGFTSQEKVATARFIEMVGVGTSDENQRRCRFWWKDLSDMQSAGVVYTLLYRNAKFNKYCKTFPKRNHSSQELIDTIVSWEKVYSSYIKQIELRAFDQARGNYSGKLDLLQTSVAEILSIPESNWDNGSNVWYSDDEEESWKLTSSCTATSTKSTLNRLAEDVYIESGTNKSFFISIRPGIDRPISVFPIVPISPGNLLGIFSGKIRFSEHCNIAQSITGPTPYLWLDYSQVTGTLNQMRVAWPGREANVCLAWEDVNKDVKNGLCEHWRVLVMAIREIMPFEPLIHAASSEEQFALHQSLDYTRKGFLEEPL